MSQQADQLCALGAAALLVPMLAPAAADADADASAAGQANAIKALQHLAAFVPELLGDAEVAAAVAGLLRQEPPLPSLIVAQQVKRRPNPL